MTCHRTLHRVLYVDLSRKSFRVEERDDIFSRQLGGSGAAIALLNELCPPDCDPLGPENPIILAVGPLTSLFPLASKTVAMFKSPHTGNLGESHCGGRSAVSIRMAGYGAIVITGKSEFPVYLSIGDGKVLFRDATTLWGMATNSTSGRIIREREEGTGLRSIMRIGTAGENLVTYASVTAETFRHFGRLGLGAVFGSKMLKGISIAGKRSFPVKNMKDYRYTYDKIFRTAVDSELMKKYHELGTAGNVKALHRLKGLPTRNLLQSEFEDVDKVSGEALAENYLGRRLACAHCPIGCIHIAALREPYADEPYFYKTRMIGYDYELIFSLGTMLGGSDTDGILKLMDAVEAVGLDAMSAGVVLAWATEALEKGIVSVEQTGGLRLSWNNYPNYIEAVKRIVSQPNDFFKALSKGVDHASNVYGGKEFALSFGKNEMPGYHTGPAAHIGYLAGARHSHLDNGGYSIDQKAFKKELPPPEELAEKIVAEESWRQILSSLVVCFFARNIYKDEVVSEALEQLEISMSATELHDLGRRILRQKYDFKEREGFRLLEERLPERIFQTPSTNGMIDPAYVKATLKAIRI
jgi:aldehyde:ferredoxin oxidoreductase